MKYWCFYEHAPGRHNYRLCRFHINVSSFALKTIFKAKCFKATNAIRILPVSPKQKTRTEGPGSLSITFSYTVGVFSTTFLRERIYITNPAKAIVKIIGITSVVCITCGPAAVVACAYCVAISLPEGALA